MSSRPEVRTLPVGAAADRPVLALQHARWESAGLVAGALDGVRLDVRTILDEARPDVPRVHDLAGLVVMGGAPDADDDARHPGLSVERRLLADAVEADIPVLGVCLGAQLLALALGARLHRRHGTEIGFAPIAVVDNDPVLAPLGANPAVLHWHSDAVDLPPGARLVASSSVTPVQAFRAGSALGVQFHLEVDAPLLATWLTTPGMTEGVSAHALADVRAGGAAHLSELVPRARVGLAAFAAAARDRA